MQRLIDEMKTLSPIAEDKGVCLALETSLNAADMVRIVEAIESDYVQVYFDTGNAAGIGYNIIQEIEGLGKHIVQTHHKPLALVSLANHKPLALVNLVNIKDNPSTQMLGEGNIDFEAAISALKRVDFRGYLMLETPSTGDSIDAAAKNLAYIKRVVDGW